ncbi:hypothetical protein EV359DRAFT_59509 [Lentinula novae-zelandiae]|nr:hypothetical protein EV359DRAFT_59509 [Lentinula novae-zelandiae]
MHFRAVCLFMLGLLAVALQAARPTVFREPTYTYEPVQHQDPPIIGIQFYLPNDHAEGDPIISRDRLVHFFHEYHSRDILIENSATQIISHDGRWPSTAASEIRMWWYITNRPTAHQDPNNPRTWNWVTMESDDFVWH